MFMNDDIATILSETDTADWDRIFEVWWSKTLRPLDRDAIPLIRDFARTTKNWQGRAAQLYYCTGFARTSATAREMAIERLSDNSLEVRYRACVLLACSRQRRLIPILKAAAQGTTRRFAEAAIAAIEQKSMEPLTALDTKTRKTYTLPIKLPCRWPYPTFAEEFHAAASSWLKKMGFVAESVFQHDAYYRRGDQWFHAYWEQWDCLWLFMRGTRDDLGMRESYIGHEIAQPYRNGTMKQVSQQLRQAENRIKGMTIVEYGIVKVRLAEAVPR